tara:strand:+ start:456 stop:1070 length:615 start_codon:yes stop_codon:yes gene_type:complete
MSLGKKIQDLVLTATDREAIYYIYRGGPKGREENLRPAIEELNFRIDNLVQNLEQMEKAVFVSDFRRMIPLVMRDRDQEPVSHPMYKFRYGTAPPGKFSTIAMGGGLAGDFMFKNSDELTNIDPMHAQFFEFPKVLGLINGAVSDATLPEGFPYEELTAKSYHYNYKLAQEIEQEEQPRSSRFASHPGLDLDAWKRSKGLLEGE